MSSLINNAMSGLNAAQAALNTASNNISSYNVAGYTRQTTIMAQANSTLGAGGWVGNGVYVSGVQREYDAFITNQLRAAQTQSSGLTARYEQMSKIDNMLSTSTSSLATQMQDFFTSLQTLVSNAEDPAARQALIGKSEGLVNQFKTTDQYLRDQDKQVNIAIGASVDRSGCQSCPSRLSPTAPRQKIASQTRRCRLRMPDLRCWQSSPVQSAPAVGFVRWNSCRQPYRHH